MIKANDVKYYFKDTESTQSNIIVDTIITFRIQGIQEYVHLDIPWQCQVDVEKPF